MTTNSSTHICLEQAKLLVEYLESDQQKKADELIAEIQTPLNAGLFEEIGKLTRQLHDSLNNFQVDGRINDLTAANIHDAKERLNFVITCTENAANKTMDAAESIFPVVEHIQKKLEKVQPLWQKLVDNELDVAAFKGLCGDVNDLLTTTSKDMTHIHNQMTSILMAQDFQDITGQVIRKVIDLVRELEDNLINMLTTFDISSEETVVPAPIVGKNLVEGPIVNAENRTDVLSGQDDVDDLLSSLGF